MNKQIKKCKICGEAYWEIQGAEYRENAKDVCPDCLEEADRKEQRQLNKPQTF